MKFLSKSIHCKEIGAIGIGAMIVFIALVLIAGVSASVLIQTAGKLEIKSMDSGRKTTTDVATGLNIIDIEGQLTSRDMAYNSTSGLIWRYTNFSGNDAEDFHAWYNKTRIHNITITITPNPGSPGIDISDMVIEITNSTVKCILSYDSSKYHPNPSAACIFSTEAFDLAPNKFGLIEIEDEDNSVTCTHPVINKGDYIFITINTSAPWARRFSH